jgi:hypothetical protein
VIALVEPALILTRPSRNEDELKILLNGRAASV